MINILLLGSGGREHAFAWKIKQSRHCNQLFIAPGNAGTARCGRNVKIQPTDFEAIKAFVLDHNIEIVVVGPEMPLVEGIYDFFKNKGALSGVTVIGPSKEAARLEGSKAFAKKFMREFGIPTASYEEFTSKNLEEGLVFISKQKPPIVLKADGLAAGKGVLICQSVEEAKEEFKAMLGGKFGVAGTRVVIEEFLRGIEFSVFVLTDGEVYKILPVAKDYKRIGTGDTGLNTGGMGAVSPVPFADAALMEKVEERIIKPTVRGLKEREMVYRGFIFLGLIKVDDEPFVIEYNCRMGDPEAEVVLARLKNDLVELFLNLEKGELQKTAIEEDAQAATTVVLVSGGYPGSYEKGKVIYGLEEVKRSLIFHAGTQLKGTTVATNGGRVLAITSLGNDFRDALAHSNKNAELIEFEGKYFREDIGFDL